MAGTERCFGTPAAPARWGRRALTLCGLAAFAALASCGGVSRPATPPPALSSLVVERGRRMGADEAFLSRGRSVFFTQCARCHALPDPDGYSRVEWEDILPRMARKARLAASDTNAVRAFVLAVRSDSQP